MRLDCEDKGYGKDNLRLFKGTWFVDRQQILDMQERVSQCHDMPHKGPGEAVII